MGRYPGVVTIFTTTTCPHCRAAKALLATKDVTVVNWEVDLYPPEVREEMSKLANGAKSVPQIFLNGKYLPGGNSNLQGLEKEGRLDQILAEALADPPGPDVPTVKVEKIKHAEDEVPAMGLGGLSRDDAMEKELRKIVHDMRAAGFAKKFSMGSAKTWLEANKFDSAKYTAALVQYGVVESVGHDKYVFSVDVDPNVLNMQFNASKVKDLKSKRTADQVVLIMRKRILQLYQTYLSKDGSSVDYAGMRVSSDFEMYVDVATELQLVTIDDLLKFSENARKAFFINLYNALAIHAFVVFGHAPTSLGRLRFFNSVSYRMGGQVWSLNMIEHGILRGNRPTPAGFFPFLRGSMFSSLPLLAKGDPRLQCTIQKVDPRIHFALNCGAKSCPPIKVFSAENIDSELALAAQAFCEDASNVSVVKDKGQIQLSMILKWYGRDFGEDDMAVARKVSEFLSAEKKTEVDSLLNSGKLTLTYTPYDWGENGKSS